MTHKGYLHPGPCLTWHFLGRDGLWYRVCVPCDSARPGPTPGLPWTLPGHLRSGYRHERDARMGARDHARDVNALRAQVATRREWFRRINEAAEAGDVHTWARLIMRDPGYAIAPDRVEETYRNMKDYLTRVTRETE